MRSEIVYTRRRRIAELAGIKPRYRLTTLNQHLDVEWLREAFRQTRKNGACGVDGMSAEAYAQDLDARLSDLLTRAKTGSYRAPLLKRAYVPKDDGGRRPLGIPCFENKVLERAVLMLLEPVYEQDFLDCSHGFRPGRSPHTALQALWKGVMDLGGCWLIDADIRKFYDTLSHAKLREIIDRRVGDGVLRRLISKWLHAGVLEAGVVTYPDEGAPQGGVISPLLSNIYLHEVLDTWFEETIKPLLKGRAFLVRYADDFVMGFEHEEDARRVYAVLAKRFAKYELTIHPEKTRLIPFFPPNAGKGEPDTFDFVGFTHYWGVSRKGRPLVQRKTMSKRFTRAVTRVREYCRQTARLPMRTQWQGLCAKLRGHYGYYGITGNLRALRRFWLEVKRIWKDRLQRRTGRGHLSWAAFEVKLARWPLPLPRVMRSVYAQ
jgi:group II intron reverse transcriptase/maturase